MAQVTDISEEEESIIQHFNGKLPKEAPILTTFLPQNSYLNNSITMKTREDRRAHSYGASMLISSGFHARTRDIY
jgi:hypothetical protein